MTTTDAFVDQYARNVQQILSLASQPDELQRRVDEEGCGAVFGAAEWKTSWIFECLADTSGGWEKISIGPGPVRFVARVE